MLLMQLCIIDISGYSTAFPSEMLRSAASSFLLSFFAVCPCFVLVSCACGNERFEKHAKYIVCTCNDGTS